MSNWFYLLQWMLIVAMFSMSHEMSCLATQANPCIRAGQAQESAQPCDIRTARVKRFAKLPPATQDKVLAYGENLLRYLKEKINTPISSSD